MLGLKHSDGITISIRTNKSDWQMRMNREKKSEKKGNSITISIYYMLNVLYFGIGVWKN